MPKRKVRSEFCDNCKVKPFRIPVFQLYVGKHPMTGSPIQEGLVASRAAELCADCIIPVTQANKEIIDKYSTTNKHIRDIDLFADLAHAAETVRSLDPVVYVVGHNLVPTPSGIVWELQGIFKHERLAIHAVGANDWWIAPLKMNNVLPEETTSWPGLYWPNRKD